VATVKSPEKRRLHKALLRWHDPANWPLIREALKQLKLAHLIGDGPTHLVPREQPGSEAEHRPQRRKNSREAHEKRIRRGQALTQHTGLPPRRTR
jgi:hypothetical protein